MFWKNKNLAEMTGEEWEQLCDRCGKCCLKKIDTGSGKFFYTRIACRSLDTSTGECIHYEDRLNTVSDCFVLRPEDVPKYKWLPETCAYRLVSEGKDLYDWHPLVSGNPESVHRAGVSVQNNVFSEEYTDIRSAADHICSFDEQGKFIFDKEDVYEAQ